MSRSTEAQKATVEAILISVHEIMNFFSFFQEETKKRGRSLEENRPISPRARGFWSFVLSDNSVKAKKTIEKAVSLKQSQVPMFDRIRKLLRNLFGGGDVLPAPATAPAGGAEASSAQPQGHADPRPATQATFAPGTMLLRLRRLDAGPWDIVGELLLEEQRLAATLEGSHAAASAGQGPLPAGTYPITLSQEGGKQSAYLFRFGERHQGMLVLGDTPSPYPVGFCLGLEARHLYSSIVLAERVDSPPQASGYRRAINSEETYLKVYERMVIHLRDDKPAVLIVEA